MRRCLVHVVVIVFKDLHKLLCNHLYLLVSGIFWTIRQYQWSNTLR